MTEPTSIPHEPMLKRIRVAGFRSLRDVSLELGRVNVLIGPNGAGKSNLLMALRLFSAIQSQSLRVHVAEQGGASSLLHYGSSTTRALDLRMDFEGTEDTSYYEAQLVPVARDAFSFTKEVAAYRKRSEPDYSQRLLGAGHAESLLMDLARDPAEVPVRVVNHNIKQLGYFHFHDTSGTSPLRQNSRQAESAYLRSDGSNLAAFLYRLKTSDAKETRVSWETITGLVRRIAPSIKELLPDLIFPDKPEQSAVRLYWIDRRGHQFDTHDLSDGTLRAIALFTALRQPPSCRPLYIVIDEPELGLHPSAIWLVGSVIRSVATYHQVIVATQSPVLLDQFDPEEVLVTEHSQGESNLKRLSSVELKDWLERYSLSELYDKNVLGGRP